MMIALLNANQTLVDSNINRPPKGRSWVPSAAEIQEIGVARRPDRPTVSSRMPQLRQRNENCRVPAEQTA